MAERILAEVVLFIVGGANDAPGFKIVPDGHGGFKVVPVPGWNPEQALELAAALRVVSAAGRLKHPESHAIVNAAAKLVQGELRNLVGEQHGTTQNVVVVVG